jgi:hypothetical protein
MSASKDIDTTKVSKFVIGTMEWMVKTKPLFDQYDAAIRDLKRYGVTEQLLMSMGLLPESMIEEQSTLTIVPTVKREEIIFPRTEELELMANEPLVQIKDDNVLDFAAVQTENLGSLFEATPSVEQTEINPTLVVEEIVEKPAPEPTALCSDCGGEKPVSRLEQQGDRFICALCKLSQMENFPIKVEVVKGIVSKPVYCRKCNYGFPKGELDKVQGHKGLYCFPCQKKLKKLAPKQDDVQITEVVTEEVFVINSVVETESKTVTYKCDGCGEKDSNPEFFETVEIDGISHRICAGLTLCFEQAFAQNAEAEHICASN